MKKILAIGVGIIFLSPFTTASANTDTSLRWRVSQLKDNVSWIQQDISGIDSDIRSLQNRLQTLEQLVATMCKNPNNGCTDTFLPHTDDSQ